MWHCFSDAHQGPAAVNLNCVVSTQLATIRDEMATSVDGLWGWSLMHQVLLSLTNKTEKQFSSDLTTLYGLGLQSKSWEVAFKS